MFTAIVLDNPSQIRLSREFKSIALQFGCDKIYCHHITLGMGNRQEFNIGEKRSFSVTHAGYIANRVFAVKVDGADDSFNETPHITVATCTFSEAKPRESNDIKNWTPIRSPITLFGCIEICK